MDETHVVLLPGMLCDDILFEHQVEHLSEVARVSVGDLTRNDSIEGMARTVLKEAPDRFALAGLSMGGIVAFEVMRQASERVTRLALLDTNARPPNEQQLEGWKEFARMVGEDRFLEVVEEYLRPVYFHPDREDPGLGKKARRMADNVGEEAFLRQLSAQAQRPDSRESLRNIRCPTVVMAGRDDALCSVAMHEEVASALPKADLVLIEQCGHLSSIEQPQAVTAVLRYWLQRGE